MAQPSSSTTAPAGALSPEASPPPATGERVTRPDPGLARGKWEAPAWVFWAMLGAILVGSALYLLRRLGMLKLGQGRAKSVDDAPASGKARRP